MTVYNPPFCVRTSQMTSADPGQSLEVFLFCAGVGPVFVTGNGDYAFRRIDSKSDETTGRVTETYSLDRTGECIRVTVEPVEKTAPVAANAEIIHLAEKGAAQ